MNTTSAPFVVAQTFKHTQNIIRSWLINGREGLHISTNGLCCWSLHLCWEAKFFFFFLYSNQLNVVIFQYYFRFDRVDKCKWFQQYILSHGKNTWNKGLHNFLNNFLNKKYSTHPFLSCKLVLSDASSQNHFPSHFSFFQLFYYSTNFE